MSKGKTEGMALGRPFTPSATPRRKGCVVVKCVMLEDRNHSASPTEFPWSLSRLKTAKKNGPNKNWGPGPYSTYEAR